MARQYKKHVKPPPHGAISWFVPCGHCILVFTSAEKILIICKIWCNDIDGTELF